MADNKNNIVEKLESAIVKVMDPFTSPELRREAYELCENFKEQSPDCIDCGFAMATTDRNHFVRHFGLQVIEHCVKFRWNSMPISDKEKIKDGVMEVVRTGTLGILAEQAHVKDAVSRIIVEIAKREWPQQWPSMMEELNNLFSLGPTQTELILMVFSRLTEDILLLQSAPVQRRRDILQGLTVLMPQLFPGFVRTLCDEFKVHLQQASDVASIRVILAVLELLTTLVDWVNISVVMNQNGLLLELLCRMMGQSSNISIQLSAIDCLLVIAGRKGKLEDRKPLMILFSEPAMAAIVNVISAVYNTPASDEHGYMFLKKLCLLLVTLGNLLAALSELSNFDEPVTLNIYLETLLALTQHPSQTVSSYCPAVWILFLKNDVIGCLAIFQSFIPRLLIVLRKALMKVGFPSASNSPCCDYARIDFDTDEDFSVFFFKYRSEVAETVRNVALSCGNVAFEYIVDCIDRQLREPVNTGNGVSDIISGHYAPYSIPVQEWDALAVFLEGVMSRGMVCTKTQPSPTVGLALMNKLLVFNVPDPFITSSLLSMISALLPFVSHSPDILSKILEWIFAAVKFSIPGQTKSTRSKAVKNTRRHACSVFIKICKQFSNQLLLQFDQLSTHIGDMCKNPEELSQMEKCTLSEGLLIISNHFHNFQKQEAFVCEVLAPVRTIWLSDAMRESLRSPDQFIRFIGLNQPAIEPSSSDTSGIHRSQIQYCVGIIHAVLKRTAIPDDQTAAENGGFMHSCSESQTSVLKNPATQPVMELLDNVLALSRTVKELWLPENLAKRHPDFTNAFDLMESDRLMLLGLCAPLYDKVCLPAYKTPVERMQSFLTNVFETSYQIFGSIGPSLGWQFYKTPNLAPTLFSSLLTNISSLPDYRLRHVIRNFLKLYVHDCPSEFWEQAVLPILSRFCSFMHSHLSTKWQVVNQRLSEADNVNSGSGDECAETQEVLQEQAIRHVTREYMDFLLSVFRDKKSADEKKPADNLDEMAVDDCGEMVVKKINESVGELGLLVLKSNEVFPSIVLTVFTSLSWNDSSVCIKGVQLCFPLLKQLVAMEKINADDACYVMSSMMCGLEMHGQHEGAQAMLINMALHSYELLRPLFPSIKNVLLQIASCTENDLQSFDQKMFSAPPTKPLTDKRKKELFRSLVNDAIGKNIGQHFRNEVTIKNLAPNVFRSTRLKVPRFDEVEENDIGLCSLFTPVS